MPLTPLPATRIGERYELGRTLGKGGMGEVRLAWDTRLGRRVAIKVLHPTLSADLEMRHRFEAEGRTAAKVTHPNVVQVYDSGEDDGVPFLVMEYVEGPTLAEEIARGPIEADRAWRIALGIARGLGAAHAQGITHCDVKPANVVLVEDEPKVTDFGIAKTVDGASSETTGVLLGTPAYLAPERLAGCSASPASDVYSAGVVFAEMLAGQATPDFEAVASLDAGLASIVRRATSLSPADRFASGADLTRALETQPLARADEQPTIAFATEASTQVLPTAAPPTTRPPTTRPPTTRPPTTRPPQSGRAGRLVPLVLLVLALGIGVAFAAGAFDGGTDGSVIPAVVVPDVTASPTIAPTIPPASVPVIGPGKATPNADAKQHGPNAAKPEK